jgi:predicted nucleic acid-binding protein
VEEQQQDASREFLQQVQSRGNDLFCPALILAECAAAIARPTGDDALAEELVSMVAGFPNLQLIALDAALAHRAAQIAISQRLRGADAIYVAVAESFDATLITWDSEMILRGQPVAPALTPADWINQAG